MVYKIKCIPDIVGIVGSFDSVGFRVYEYSEITGVLKIASDINGDGRGEVTEEICYLLGEERFFQTLRVNYGLEIEVILCNDFSEETIHQSQRLSQAGFLKLTIDKDSDNYTVDGLYTQNFLIQKELDYLLKENVEEILLSDIK